MLRQAQHAGSFFLQPAFAHARLVGLHAIKTSNFLHITQGIPLKISCLKFTKYENDSVNKRLAQGDYGYGESYF
jgi:hypothetical protein